MFNTNLKYNICGYITYSMMERHLTSLHHLFYILN